MQEFRKRYSGPLADLPGLPEWERELLCARGMDTPEKAEKFLHPSLEDLHDPLLMQDMEKAVKLIRAAIQRGDRIMVYGDYDVDGVSAVTVMVETLREEIRREEKRRKEGLQRASLREENSLEESLKEEVFPGTEQPKESTPEKMARINSASVEYYIPSRHEEGYGLNLKAVEGFADRCNLLITVDCGITNVQEVKRAKELGMTVIVTDHHEPPEKLPAADAVLNPLLGDYPFRRLCGAGVALKICQALQGREGAEKLLEIAALATVADIVPLVDENRVIVREGMWRMKKTSRPGLKKLLENARVTFPMHADDIGFRLGPRLNAAGRLGDAKQGARLLMTPDPAEARALADQLEEYNRRRQEEEQAILKEAMSLFPAQVNLRKDRVIILRGEGWNPGLIGLVAGKICEKFHHPTIVLSVQEENAVGSCRSVPGVNIWQMLNQCGDLFLRFGGHAQAAGLTILPAEIPRLRERLNRVIRENCDDRCFLPVKEYDSELSLSQVTLEMIRNLEALEPVGCGNPAPVFLCRGAKAVVMSRVGKDRSHLKLTLLQEGELRDGIGFGLGDAADQGPQRVDVLFRPSRNEFNGRVSPQLQVQALQAANMSGAGTIDLEDSAASERHAGNDALPPAKKGTEKVLPANEEDIEAKVYSIADQKFFLACLQEMTMLASKKTESPAEASLRPEHLMKERLEAVDPSREAMGKVYLAIRSFSGGSLEALTAAAEAPREQILFALCAFEQMSLLQWSLEPFRVEMLPRSGGKIPLESSPLVRYVQGLQSGN